MKLNMYRACGNLLDPAPSGWSSGNTSYKPQMGKVVFFGQGDGRTGRHKIKTRSPLPNNY